MKPDILIFSFCVSMTFPLEFRGRARGAHQIANYMRQSGYSVQVISMVEKFSYEELCKIIDDFVTPKTIIGVSIVFPLENEQFIPIAKALVYAKEKYNGIKLVCGGNPPKHISKAFDKVFEGYSEQEFLQYVNFLKVKPTKNFFDIQELDFKWDDSDCIMPNEVLPIEISRGCIFKCAFCSYKLNGKKKLDYLRNAKLVAEELMDNYNRFGITKYYFLDDTFNDSNSKLEALHSEITKLPFKIEFWTYLRADLLARYPEQMKLMKEMGLRHAFFGIETFNNDSGKAVHKGSDREKMKTFLENLHDNEDTVSINIGLIAGLPYDSEKNIIDTIEYTKRFTKWPIHYSVLGFQFHLEEKSEMSKDPQKYGYTFDNKGWINNRGLTQEQAIQTLRKHKTPNIIVNTLTTKSNDDEIKINKYLLFHISPYSHLLDVDKLSGKILGECVDYIQEKFDIWFNDYKNRILTLADSEIYTKKSLPTK